MTNKSVLCANTQYRELDWSLTINVFWHCWLLKILFSAQVWEVYQQAFEIQWEKSHLDRTQPLICPLKLPMTCWKCLFSHYLPHFPKFQSHSDDKWTHKQSSQARAIPAWDFGATSNISQRGTWQCVEHRQRSRHGWGWRGMLVEEGAGTGSRCCGWASSQPCKEWDS